MLAKERAFQAVVEGLQGMVQDKALHIRHIELLVNALFRGGLFSP